MADPSGRFLLPGVIGASFRDSCVWFCAADEISKRSPVKGSCGVGVFRPSYLAQPHVTFLFILLLAVLVEWVC
jgi:hypothetical protein